MIHCVNLVSFPMTELIPARVNLSISARCLLCGVTQSVRDSPSQPPPSKTLPGFATVVTLALSVSVYRQSMMF